MTDMIQLQSGAEIGSPTLLPNPQSSLDARILRETFARYDIGHLDGFVVNLEDLAQLRDDLFERQTVQTRLQSDIYGADEQNGGGLKDIPLFIYPDMSPLMGYSYGGEEEELLALSLDNGDEVIPDEIDLAGALDQLSNATEEGKRRLRQRVLNPQLEERETIQNVMEFQIQQGADIVLSPSIPITSMQDFGHRLGMVENIFRTSSAIVEGGLLSADMDLMHTFSINPSILRRPEDGASTREDDLVDVMTSSNADFLGVHLQDLNHEHRDRVQALLDVIDRVGEETDTTILLLNVDEFGLVSFDCGVDAISGTIASTPYDRFSTGGSTPSRGKYYHYEDLFGYTRERLMEMTRPEYRFPCYCEICERFETIPAVDSSHWNEFRRIHYLLVKDKEIKRIRDTDKVLRESLRDMIANSERTELASYL